jgi:hypothetical protein
MMLPFLDPLRGLVAARVELVVDRAANALATGLLAAMAVGLLVSAGLVALSRAIGFPAAALVFAALFALLALAAHLLGRSRAARRSALLAAARGRTEADIVVARELARLARPILPLAAFLSVFVLAQRR